MKFYEYGSISNPSVLYIHGMGCDVLKSFKVPTEVLQEDYRIIAVSLDGYDGETSTFSTINEQAEKISAFLNKNYNGRVYAVIGMSIPAKATISFTEILRALILSERRPSQQEEVSVIFT